MRDRGLEGPTRGSGTSSLVLGLAVVAAGLSVILLGAWYTLAGRVRAVERGAGSQARASRALDQLSGRIDRLSDRIRAAEEDRLSARSIERRLADLGSEIATLKRSNDRSGLSKVVEEFEDIVRSLRTEIEGVRRIAQEAAKREIPAPAPAAAAGAGADPEEVSRLSTRLGAVEQRVEGLAKKPTTPATGTTPRVNEEALRRLIERQVREGLPAAIREAMSNWRRPGTQGRRDRGQ